MTLTTMRCGSGNGRACVHGNKYLEVDSNLSGGLQTMDLSVWDHSESQYVSVVQIKMIMSKCETIIIMVTG